MATFEKYRQRQKGQESTLLLQSALVESKNNVLEPKVGNGSEIGPYFEDLANRIQEEELQTKRRKQERSASVQAAAPLLNLRRAYARANAKAEKCEGTTAGVDAEDEEEDDGEEDVPDSDLSRNPRDEPSVSGHALEVVYREALRVIVNRVGASDTSNAVASSDMYAHLQDVYRVGSEKHQELFGKEQAAEKPDFHVRVNVVAGQDLDSMDENEGDCRVFQRIFLNCSEYREWQVLAEAQQRHGVKFSRLIECIDVLSAEYAEAEAKNIRLSESKASDLVTSMESFVNTTLQLLGKQRDIFPPNSTTSGMPAVRRLSNLLVSVSAVYKFKGFTNFFPKRNCACSLVLLDLVTIVRSP